MRIQYIGRIAPLLLGAALAAGCGRAPAIGSDKEAFTTVDAVYSAVSLRDTAQLERNAATLDQLREAGRLPDEAHKALAGIIGKAQEGKWEPAREELRDFMLDQRP